MRSKVEPAFHFCVEAAVCDRRTKFPITPHTSATHIRHLPDQFVLRPAEFCRSIGLNPSRALRRFIHSYLVHSNTIRR
jgi:hypothetical protein